MAIGAALVSFWMAAGLVSIAYVVLFAFAIAPGLPLGFALFGRRHAAGWISGALIGYGLTQLTLWLVIVSGLASTLTFIVAWLLLLAVTTLLARGFSGGPFVFLPEWRAADTRALLLVLVLVPVLMGPPYRNLGRADETGNRYYRAYFTADFLWHSALAYELGNFASAAAESLHDSAADELLLDLFPVACVRGETRTRRHWATWNAASRPTRCWRGFSWWAPCFCWCERLSRVHGRQPLPSCLAIVAASAEGIYEIVTLAAAGPSADRPARHEHRCDHGVAFRGTAG